MSALLYLVRKSLKNALLELLHHPGKLIAYVFIIAMMLFSGISATLGGAPEEGYRDIRMLEGIYLGVLLLLTAPTLLRGLRSGASFFNMSDVNLLFVAPISPKKILLYGLMRQMGATLLICFFLLSYGGMAISSFGIPVAMGVGLLIGLAAAIFLVQLLAMFLYSLVNGRPERIRAVKYTLYVVFLLILGYVGASIYLNGLSMESALAAISSPVLEYVPVLGWIKGLLFACLNGDMVHVLLFAVLLLAGAGVILLLFLRVDADYYEDVLENAENTYAMKEAAKSGNMDANMKLNPRKIRVGATGLRGGNGASAFFYKHLLEIRRRSRLIFLSGSSLLLVACCLGMAFIMKSSGDEDPMSPNMIMMIAAMMGIYLQFFMNATGEWSREMTKPYLFLVPVSPFLKLVWASLTSLIKPLADGLISYILCAVVVGAGPAVTVLCILMYMTFGWVFTASSILSERVLGGVANKGLLVVLYMLLLMALVAPGIIAGVVLGVLIEGMPKILMALPVIVWNILLTLAGYALSRNTLHNMEASQ